MSAWSAVFPVRHQPAAPTWRPRSGPIIAIRTIAGVLLYGPIGALVGATMDSSVARKQAAKPVFGIIYRENGAEQAVFLEFPLASWYRKLNSFLLECLPEQHRE